MEKVKTIQLQGKDYAQVKDRLQAFKKDFPKWKVHTEYNFKDGFVIFKATLFPQFDKQEDMWTWHAFGKLDKQKAFEKLETIAVGRALWLAWYWSDWDIASFDEMKEFLDSNSIIEKVPFKKQQFKELVTVLNDWWTTFANWWIEDNKEVFNINDPIKEKIMKIYAIYKQNQNVSEEDINNTWKDLTDKM